MRFTHYVPLLTAILLLLAIYPSMAVPDGWKPAPPYGEMQHKGEPDYP